METLPDIIAPVPMHPKRQRARGFNHSIALAQTVSRALHIPIAPRLMKRKHNTKAQREQTAIQRRHSVSDTFYLSSCHAKASGIYKHVAIIDDVVTTGSTVSSMSRTLKEHGIKRVDIWAIARTPGKTTQTLSATQIQPPEMTGETR